MCYMDLILYRFPIIISQVLRCLGIRSPPIFLVHTNLQSLLQNHFRHDTPTLSKLTMMPARDLSTCVIQRVVDFSEHWQTNFTPRSTTRRSNMVRYRMISEKYIGSTP